LEEGQEYPDMPYTRPLIVAALIISLGGCSTMETSYQYDRASDFTGYRTYGWIAGPQEQTGDPRIDDKALESYIRSAVEGQLGANGYEKQSTGVPDFLVCYHVALNRKLASEAIDDYYRYVPGTGQSYRATPPWAEYKREYEEGSLILDILDGQDKKLVYRGFAYALADPSPNPEKLQRRVNEAVRRVLKTFPPD
jgi:hypothetical protein